MVAFGKRFQLSVAVGHDVYSGGRGKDGGTHRNTMRNTGGHEEACLWCLGELEKEGEGTTIFGDRWRYCCEWSYRGMEEEEA